MMDELSDMLCVKGQRAQDVLNQHHELLASNTTPRRNTLHCSCCQLHKAYMAYVRNLQQNAMIFADGHYYHASSPCNNRSRPCNDRKCRLHALLYAIIEAALSSAHCHGMKPETMQKVSHTYSEVCVVEHHTVKGHAV